MIYTTDNQTRIVFECSVCHTKVERPITPGLDFPTFPARHQRHTLPDGWGSYHVLMRFMCFCPKTECQKALDIMDARHGND